MRDYDREANKDGAQGQPPQKAKKSGGSDPAHKHAEGQTAAAHPDILRDERLAHPANAEPLAELFSQLQHSHGNAYVQRFVSEAGGEKKQEPKPEAELHAGGGAQALDAGTRSQMETAFGESFGDVRVHTGKPAGEAAEELGARAYTRGRDIYFNEGEYNPSTLEGRELLAHELTHVVQQRGGSSAQGASVGRAGDTFEREADDIAASVVRGARVLVERQGAAPAYQRQTAGQRADAPRTATAAPSGAPREIHLDGKQQLTRGSLGDGFTYYYLHDAPTDYYVIVFHTPPDVELSVNNGAVEPEPRVPRATSRMWHVVVFGRHGQGASTRVRFTRGGQVLFEVQFFLPPKGSKEAVPPPAPPRQAPK